MKVVYSKIQELIKENYFHSLSSHIFSKDENQYRQEQFEINLMETYSQLLHRDSVDIGGLSKRALQVVGK
ncbi:MAG: hypothetical protein KC516_04450 [Nanoarchaeota archaeon]|nr:hypothetical protein [Nanoarchaeota archaeon]